MDINLTCKYAHWRKVMDNASDDLKFILNSAPVHGFAQMLVDVKVQDLKVGEYTCIPGWHADSKNVPAVRHHLWVSGQNRTEFLMKDGSVQMIPNETWVSYGHDLHRGPRVKVAERRILVRITETNNLMKGNTRLLFT